VVVVRSAYVTESWALSVRGWVREGVRVREKSGRKVKIPVDARAVAGVVVGA